MKAVVAVAAVAILSGCASSNNVAVRDTPKFKPITVSDIQRREEDRRARMLADIQKREAERKAKEARCNALPNVAQSVNIEQARQVVLDQPWKDPFSVKITKITGASPKLICQWQNGIGGFYSIPSMQRKVPQVVGTLYAKNGYGAYSGATTFVVLNDGTVWTSK